MKAITAATSLNSHELKKLKRFHRPKMLHTMTHTFQNEYNAWNRRNLFLSILTFKKTRPALIA